MARTKKTKPSEGKTSTEKVKKIKSLKGEASTDKVREIKPVKSEVSTDKVQEIKPLKGEALINKVKELPNSSKEDKAKACGYYTVTKNGVERVNMMKFLNALLDAEEISLNARSNDGSGHVGRNPSYRITVQSNGSLLVGSAYTKKLGLKPGDEFTINLGRKHIKLVPISDQESSDELAA